MHITVLRKCRPRRLPVEQSNASTLMHPLHRRSPRFAQLTAFVISHFGFPAGSSHVANCRFFCTRQVPTCRP